jgi:hypothetical protein
VSAGANSQRAWFDGEYSNHEQVVQALPAVLPRVHITVTPLSKSGWYVWQLTLAGNPEVAATWVMRSARSGNGDVVMTPFRAVSAAPGMGKNFDIDQWVALDACALQGVATPKGMSARADAIACSTLAPGIGASAALLPLDIEHDGDRLGVRLYADQARGPEARVDARRVRWFSGWAAVNGAGANARVESNDWHMSRDIRISSEGGRAALNWRDGKSSGYSLQLERMTYRDGNVPVLKLSILEDASGRSVVFAWANPEATRIGINLGWVQVGLDAAEAGR